MVGREVVKYASFLHSRSTPPEATTVLHFKHGQQARVTCLHIVCLNQGAQFHQKSYTIPMAVRLYNEQESYMCPILVGTCQCFLDVSGTKVTWAGIKTTSVTLQTGGGG